MLEVFVRLGRDFSRILALTDDGEGCFWAWPDNVHRDGILSLSTVPAGPLITAQADEAKALAGKVADALDYVGVLTLEFFAGEDGPVFHEMAPRVHNSGHWNLEGAITSQFENHILAICGLPLGRPNLVTAKTEQTKLNGDEVDDAEK